MVRAFALALFALAACTAPATDEAIGANPQTAPSRYAGRIEASCAGGFTGGGRGVTITDDHRVIAWRRASFRPPREETDHGANEALSREVRRELEAMDFASISYHQPGNMTCSLSAGGNSVAWPIGARDTPAPVIALHQRIMAATSAD